MERVLSADQLLVKNDGDCPVCLPAAKFVYASLLSGTETTIGTGFNRLYVVFKLRATSINPRLNFLGCSIDVCFDMSVKLSVCT